MGCCPSKRDPKELFLTLFLPYEDTSVVISLHSWRDLSAEPNHASILISKQPASRNGRDRASVVSMSPNLRHFVSAAPWLRHLFLFVWFIMHHQSRQWKGRGPVLSDTSPQLATHLGYGKFLTLGCALHSSVCKLNVLFFVFFRTWGVKDVRAWKGRRIKPKENAFVRVIP